jgi:P pilus assembly chaperone PapD
MKNMKASATRAICAIWIGVALMGATRIAMATGMVPETSVVLINEADGEATMNVKNSESTPQLLHTSINHIEEDQEDLVVVTPPVARVEGNDTQVVRFILRNKTPLKTERLARAVFEGIPPRGAKDGEARVTMTVRQDLPLVIHPKGIPLEREPWKLLKIRVAGGELVIENPSPYVVRLAQAAQFQPGNEGVELPRPYVLPETTVKVPLNGNPGAPTALRLFPATLYGFAVESFDAPLVQAQAAK